MRVAQLIDQLRLSGGAERLQQTFAHAVRDRGVELTIITLHRNRSEARQLFEAAGARVVHFDARRFASPSRAVALTRFLRAERFDVLHTHLVRSTVLGALAGRAVGLPIVASLHNTRRNEKLSRTLIAAERFALRHAVDRVVAVGWETARAHQPHVGAREIDVIPNAVLAAPAGSTEARAALRAERRAELGIPAGAPLVIAVGRLHPQKAFGDLLRAFATLRRSLPEARLLIAGVGRQRLALESEIEALGLTGSAQLLGLRRDVPALLAASDVYASSARWEGLPVATLEAMAAGVPVVVTGVGDVPRVVTPEVGTLVPPGDPDALAEALRVVLADPALRAAQGRAGAALVEREFGAAAWAERQLEIYRTLVAAKTGAGPRATRAAEPRCAS